MILVPMWNGEGNKKHPLCSPADGNALRPKAPLFTPALSGEASQNTPDLEAAWGLQQTQNWVKPKKLRGSVVPIKVAREPDLNVCLVITTHFTYL